jgi:hypothetical protein
MYTYYYDLNSASRIYREERLTQARKRHLTKQARAHRKQRWQQSGVVVGFAWTSVLSLVHGALSSE